MRKGLHEAKTTRARAIHPAAGSVTGGAGDPWPAEGEKQASQI